MRNGSPRGLVRFAANSARSRIPRYKSGMPTQLAVRVTSLALLAMTSAWGCMSFTPGQRVQDAATDLATATRFGRMDIALEHVSREARDRFAKEHANWGTAVRIMDCDVVGMRLRDKEHADVTVTINWQRPDESEMRSTQVVQHWTDHRGSWLLDDEERTTGDIGLHGETTTVIRPPPSRAQFDSITIR